MAALLLLSLRRKRIGYDLGMKPVLLWIILAIAGSLLAGTSFVLFLGHATESDDIAGEPRTVAGRQQSQAQQAALADRWGLVALCSEVVTLALWMKVAHAWNRSSPSSRPWVRYAIMAVVALITGPIAVMALFAIGI
jgi:hypothetical protein